MQCVFFLLDLFSLFCSMLIAFSSCLISLVPPSIQILVQHSTVTFDALSHEGTIV